MLRIPDGVLHTRKTIIFRQVRKPLTHCSFMKFSLAYITCDLHNFRSLAAEAGYMGRSFTDNIVKERPILQRVTFH